MRSAMEFSPLTRFWRHACRWGVAATWVLLTLPAGAETIEILYEPGTNRDWAAETWTWMMTGMLALAVLLVAGLYWRLRRTLNQRAELLRQAEQRLKEAQLVARIGSWSRDFASGETFWSDEARKVLELEGQEKSFRHYERMIHPDDLDRVTEVVATAYHQGGSYQCDHRIISPGGKEKYIRLSGQVYLGDSNTPVRETGTVQDISERRLADLALQRSERRLRAILDATPYPILILENADTFPVLYVNRAAHDLFTLEALAESEDLVALSLWQERQQGVDFFARVLRDRSASDQDIQLRNRSGELLWAQLSGSVMDFAGTDAIFVAIVDVTERHTARLELERLATTDSLTGLFNRRHFLLAAGRELKRSMRYELPYTMLMLDLDHFKRVNDTYGHSFGDNVIRRFAEVARGCLRDEDLLGRMGGEEFCAVLVSSGQEGGYLVAERIRKRWQEEAFEFQGARFNFTISIGVACQARDCETVESIMERADAGLYSAKRAGRNCVIVHGGERADGSRQQKPA